MRPPILGWKVMLLLLAVVCIGAALGGAVRPRPAATSNRTIYGYRNGSLGSIVGAVLASFGGGWTGYQPVGQVHLHAYILGPVSGPTGSAHACSDLTAMLRNAPPTEKAWLLKQAKFSCQKHR